MHAWHPTYVLGRFGDLVWKVLNNSFLPIIYIYMYIIYTDLHTYNMIASPCKALSRSCEGTLVENLLGACFACTCMSMCCNA